MVAVLGLVGGADLPDGDLITCWLSEAGELGPLDVESAASVAVTAAMFLCQHQTTMNLTITQLQHSILQCLTDKSASYSKRIARPRVQSNLTRCPITVDGASVEPVSVVPDLGVYIASNLGAATHVRRIVSRCFAALRQLRHLRCNVTNDCIRSLVVSLVHSRLDYGNFLFIGIDIDI